jgi:hypothetical protein
VRGVVDDEATMGFGTRLGAYTDASSRCVVADHAVVMVPEHVLWWGRALKQDIKWHIGWEQDSTRTRLYNDWEKERVQARMTRSVRD